MKMKELLKNKVFIILLITDFIQSICIWIRNIALLFYVMEMTNNNPVAVSLLTVLEYLPMLFFTYIGGTFADKWNPKKTMIFGDSLSAVSVLIILMLVSQGYWKVVFGATFVSAVVSQFSFPSSIIMLKKYVPEEQISLAVSISQTLQSLFLIIGPIAGAYAYYSVGIRGSLILIIILFCISAATQFLLPSLRMSHLKKESLIVEMKAGINYLMANKNLLVLAVGFFFVSLSQGIVEPLSVFVFMERLGLPKESVQWFYSIGGIGLLAGTILAGVFIKKLNYKIIIISSVCFFSVSIITEVLSIWVILTASMQFVTGMISAFIQVVISTLELTLVEEEYIGRVNGLIAPINIGGFVLGSSISGVMMVHLTLIPTYFISAGIMLAGAFVYLKLSFKKVKEQ